MITNCIIKTVVVILVTLFDRQGHCEAQGHLMSSTARFQDFADLDLSSGLNKYIDHETKRLEIIKSSKGYEDEVPVVRERLKLLQVLSQDLVSHKTERDAVLKTLDDYHPTSALRLISHFLHNWEDKLHNETAYGFRFAEFLSNNDNSRLPNKTDLTLAATALAEIHFLYNLSALDLYAGKVMGQQGSPLRPQDAYEVGVVSLTLRHLRQAASWFQAAIDHTPKAEMTSEGVKKASYPVAEAVAQLGVLKYGMDEKGDGLKLLEMATDLAPENEEIRRQYLAHRFGRDVKPLVHSKHDSATLHWFRSCANASSAFTVKMDSSKSYHICRYRRSAVTPYKVYREEILSRSPFLSLVYNFLNTTDAQRVVSATGSKLDDQPVSGARQYQYLVQGKQLESKVNISRKISERISDLTGLDLTETTLATHDDEWPWQIRRPPSTEPLHVLNYGISGAFLPHYDIHRNYEPTNPIIRSGYRMATVLIYLSDVKAGGATAFPLLDITVTPVKGNALLWYNASPGGAHETALLHAGCPVAVGAKWVASKGIWSYGNELRHPCGRKVTSSHLAVDKILAGGQNRRT